MWLSADATLAVFFNFTISGLAPCPSGPAPCPDSDPAPCTSGPALCAGGLAPCASAGGPAPCADGPAPSVRCPAVCDNFLAPQAFFLIYWYHVDRIYLCEFVLIILDFVLRVEYFPMTVPLILFGFTWF